MSPRNNVPRITTRNRQVAFAGCAKPSLFNDMPSAELTIGRTDLLENLTIEGTMDRALTWVDKGEGVFAV